MAIAKGQARIVRPVTQYTGWLDCLNHLHRELGRLQRPVDSLEYYQREILSELSQGPVSEAAIASLYDWWNYDHRLEVKADEAVRQKFWERMRKKN